MKSEWRIDPPQQEEKLFGKHPTQKPLQLLERIILASTDEGDLILDPFAGSSTTGIAAARMNRKSVGIELEAEYIELSIKRYKLEYEEKEQNALFNYAKRKSQATGRRVSH